MATTATTGNPFDELVAEEAAPSTSTTTSAALGCASTTNDENAAPAAANIAANAVVAMPVAPTKRRSGGKVASSEAAAPSAQGLAARAVPHRRISSYDYMNPTKRNTQEDHHDVLDPFLVHERDGSAAAAAATPSSSPPVATDVLFEVFDGHGGRGTVDFVSHALPCNVRHYLGAIADGRVGEGGDGGVGSPADVRRALHAAFLLTDIQNHAAVDDASGATAVACLLRSERRAGSAPDEYTHRLYCANAGDSRAVLYRDGKPLRLSYDHKAEDEAEQRRVASLGGFTMRNRILGVLAISRSFGDHAFKKFVTAEPHISGGGEGGRQRRFLRGANTEVRPSSTARAPPRP